MRTQKELFEDWQLKCAIMRDVGGVIQNDLENATNDELFDLYLDFEKFYRKALEELDTSYIEIKHFLRTEMGKKI